MRYPCSYLIYSEAFQGLPIEAKMVLYRHLSEVLTGKETTKDFAHITDEGKKAVREILMDTCPDFAAHTPK